jgi:hypothetical protein
MDLTIENSQKLSKTLQKSVKTLRNWLKIGKTLHKTLRNSTATEDIFRRFFIIPNFAM